MVGCKAGPTIEEAETADPGPYPIDFGLLITTWLGGHETEGEVVDLVLSEPTPGVKYTADGAIASWVSCVRYGTVDQDGDMDGPDIYAFFLRDGAVVGREKRPGLPYSIHRCWKRWNSLGG